MTTAPTATMPMAATRLVRACELDTGVMRSSPGVSADTKGLRFGPATGRLDDTPEGTPLGGTRAITRSGQARIQPAAAAAVESAGSRWRATDWAPAGHTHAHETEGSAPLPPAGIAYGLLSALAFGAGDFVGATAARRAGVLVVVAGSQLVGLVALLIALLVVRPAPPGIDGIALGLLAGTAGAIGLAGLFGGMAIGSMGLVAALSGAGSLTIPLIVGALTGVRVAPLQLVGIGAAAAAGVAASGASRGDLGRRALLLSAVAALGFGTWYVLLDLAAQVSDPLWTLVLSRIASAGVTAAAAVGRFDRARFPLRVVIAAGLLDVGGNVLYLAARGEMAVGLAAALSGLYPIVTMLLARFILRERLSPLGLIGVGLAVTAVVLISIGG